MTPEQYQRFKRMQLLRQEVLITGDTMTIAQWRRDKGTGLILKAKLFAETLLTLHRGQGK